MEYFLLVNTHPFHFSLYLISFQGVRLPSQKVLSELSEIERNTILREGYTLLTLYCKENCEEIIDFLENLSQSKGFEELYVYIPPNQTENFLIISNFRYLEKIENLTISNLKKEICEHMLNPPIECWV